MEEKSAGNKLTAVLCFLMIFTGLGFVSSPRSLFVIPVTEALEIERSLYSFVDSLRYVATATVNLFFGALVTRFGARRLIGVGFLALTASMLLYTFSHTVWLLYLAGILIGIGFSFTATTMVGYVIGRAYPKNRGTVMGAVLAANGLGGALSTPIVSALIHSEVGYRGATLTVAAIVFAVGAVTVIFLRDSGTATEEAHQKKEQKEETAGSAAGSLLTARFLLLSACIFVTGFCLQGIQGVAAAHMDDVGISEEMVAVILSLHMLCLTVSKFMTGFLYDRFGLRIAVLIDMLGAVGVSLLLALLVPGAVGNAMGLGYAVLSALALPLETVMLPIYAREFFGAEHFAGRLGILVSINTAGYALGAPFLNLIFDRTGTYLCGFLTTAALMAAVTLTVQFLIPRKSAR